MAVDEEEEKDEEEEEEGKEVDGMEVLRETETEGAWRVESWEAGEYLVSAEVEDSKEVGKWVEEILVEAWREENTEVSLEREEEREADWEVEDLGKSPGYTEKQLNLEPHCLSEENCQLSMF